MKRVVVPVALAAVLATTALAFAAQQTEGTVKSYSMTGHEFTLQDGTVFYLSSNFTDPGIKAGAKVRISWDMQNGKHQASAVTLLN